MENITELFNDLYMPQKALIIYESETGHEGVYVEAYDMDERGRPINAHPLSVQESIALADSLNASTELNTDCLKPSGLLPENVLYLRQDKEGFALWYTQRNKVNMLFAEGLDIPCGVAEVPPLVWKANKEKLWVYAIKSDSKPNENTALQAAPFFNIYPDGCVCMGTVEIEAENAACLEDFMAGWEQYFWNSYFSHLIGEHAPVKGNIVQLWQQQVNTGRKFPAEVLNATGKKLKDLI